MFLNIISSLIICAFTSFINANEDFYTFSVVDSEGKSTSLEKYRGKVTLVVNVASECGFTDKHYKGLVNAKNLLQSTEKFEILAFPCNQFGAQEPKDLVDILDFARSTYDVNFPIFEKLKVAEDAADIYKFLEKKTSYAPNWNFWKYLVDHNGEVIGFWGPWTDVEEAFPSIRSAVEIAIAEAKQPQKPTFQADPPSPPRDDEMMSPSEVRQPGVRAGSGPPSPLNAHAPGHSGPRHEPGPPEAAPSRSGAPTARGEGRAPAHHAPAYKHDDL